MDFTRVLKGEKHSQYMIKHGKITQYFGINGSRLHRRHRQRSRVIRVLDFRNTEVPGSGARLSKVPKLYGPFSGVTIRTNGEDF